MFPPMFRYLHLWVSSINTCLDSKNNLETNKLFPKNPVPPDRFTVSVAGECLFGQNGGPQPVGETCAGLEKYSRAKQYIVKLTANMQPSDRNNKILEQ